MRIRKLHSWDVTPKEAIEIQWSLRDLVDLKRDNRPVRAIAGLDVSFPTKTTVMAGVVVLSWPSMEVVEAKTKTKECNFPYIPGLLAFREVPVLLDALEDLTVEPDLLMCDAQGIAHQRGMGMATHLGIIVDKPSIGCAKSLLYGEFEEPERERASVSYIYDKTGKVIGAAVRTRDGTKPVYVSIGNKIDLKTAIDWVMATSKGYRIPEPLRLAHRLSIGEKIDTQGQQGGLFQKWNQEGFI